MKRLWGVFRLSDIYDSSNGAHIKLNGRDRYVFAVAEPHTMGKLRGAWEVFRGRAYAFEWPKEGDLENIIDD
jgi:hypothetical protein